MSTELHRTRIKFCGLTRAEDIDAAAGLGVDAIGLIFAARSPRRLGIEQAARLRERIPAFVTCVALVMDAEPGALAAMIDAVRPDLLQFHGNEPAATCRAHGMRYLKAVPMADPAQGLAQMREHADALAWVFDSHALGAAGGSGRPFDWDAMPVAARERVVLAGGLDEHNVGAAVRAVRPWAVDVSSGIEQAPGVKDPDRMRRFVAAVRRADQERFG